MTRREARVFAWFGAAMLFMMMLIGMMPHADASPDNDCDLYDVRLCNPSHVRYCPDTHTQISAFEPCPNLIFGPNLPGHDQDDDE